MDTYVNIIINNIHINITLKIYATNVIIKGVNKKEEEYIII